MGEVLKARKSDVRIVAVKPRDSAVLSGSKPGPHHILGIGAGFVPPLRCTEKGRAQSSTAEGSNVRSGHATAIGAIPFGLEG